MTAMTPRLRNFFAFATTLVLIGLAIAAYAAVHHYQVKTLGTTQFACNINATFSCDDVAKSPYSEFFGTPVAVLGVGFYVALAVLLIISILRPDQRKAHQMAFFWMTMSGAVVALVLAGISAVLIGKFCISCLATYGVILTLAGIAWQYRDLLLNPEFTWNELGNGLGNGFIVVLLAVFVYRNLVPPPMQQKSEMSKSEMEQLISSVKSSGTKLPISRSAYEGLGEDYRKGPDDSPVQIVEFADYQCPACGMAANTLKEVQTKYREKVQIVFRNYPLSSACNPSVNANIHPHACLAATMARCVGEIGKFWEYNEIVFAGQSRINPTTLREWAKSLGLSPGEIERCESSDFIKQKIAEDIKLAQSLKVESTPSIFINGQLIRSNSFEEIDIVVSKIILSQ